MSQQPSDLYIYLLRRDKQGARIISRLKSKPVRAIKLQSVASLNLPINIANSLDIIIYESRMDWEPWLETANSFQDLRASIKKRGYINIPTNNQPELRIFDTELPVANVSNLQQPSVMLQNANPIRLFS